MGISGELNELDSPSSFGSPMRLAWMLAGNETKKGFRVLKKLWSGAFYLIITTTNGSEAISPKRGKRLWGDSTSIPMISVSIGSPQ